MARRWRRLSFSDREKLEKLLTTDKPVAKIAEELGFNRATIYAELKRCDSPYSAIEAQKNLK